MTIEATLLFLVTLVACYIAVRKSVALQGLSVRFADVLQRRAFPAPSDFEHIKFAFLRIIFGGLLLNRAVQIFIYMLPEEYGTAAGLCAIATIVSAVFVMVGLFTQWSLVFSMGFLWQTSEGILKNSTLGNDIAAALSLLLLLTSAGKFLSVDGWILSRLKNKSWCNLLLYDHDIPSKRTIALAKFVSLFAYFLVCVFSICVHLHESAWMTGVAGPYLLSNNFMTAPHEFFTQLFVQYPIAVIIAKFSLWVMMVWYPTIIPFVLMGGIFRWYIVYWGLAFLILSSFVLQLGSLAEFEFVFWAGIFWANTALDSRKKLSVYYDDTCNLCDRTVLVITVLDIFNRVALRPLSKHTEELRSYGISHEAAMQNLYGIQEENGTAKPGTVTSGTVKFGYDFYIMLAKNLFLLWPVLPFLYLGKILLIGPAIYSLVAQKRHAMFGVCKLPTKKVERSAPVTSDKLPIAGNAVVLHVMLMALCYIVAIPYPYLNIQGFDNIGAKAAAFYGIAPINVFNREDLRMAENWFTLRDIKNDSMVPLFAKDGSRLRMHRSDRVYFGHTLLFRRSVIDKEGCFFNEWQAQMEYLSKVYLHSINAPAGTYPFEYVQYKQPLPNDAKVNIGEYVLEPVTTPCTKTYDIDYKP
ncbi:MAG: DUF393 domain-containing protein [Alphaproteobacteria bacterium]|nr:DUF393 domain-containing protein [Alphaproteobacteria bacterium]